MNDEREEIRQQANILVTEKYRRKRNFEISNKMKKVFQILIYIFAFIGFGLTAGYFAVKFGLTNTSGIIDSQRETFLQNGRNGLDAGVSVGKNQNGGNYYWASLPEWRTIKEAVVKDKDLIYRASATAGVNPRILVTQLAVEQLRLFYTERESYKKFFEPLKILGSQTQFSWGVMGIKEETAIQIENNLKNKSSQFYLGPEYEHLLNFQTSDIKNERFVRMTDQHAHYYSYLYAGLYLKQVETQWKNAGFDISNKPAVLSTLYNIGFANSKPNANPQSGGAEIKIGDHVYSFGSLGAEFYNSNELTSEFPR